LICKIFNLKPKKSVKKIYILLIIFLLLPLTDITAWETDRRTPQFRKNFSYAILPFPYSLPGVGSGVGIGGGVLNINETYIDAYGLIIEGDVQGQAYGIADIHLIQETLILDLGQGKISKAGFPINFSRGMGGDEDPNDFNTAEISDTTFSGGQLVLTFFERRMEFKVQSYEIEFNVTKIRDNEGEVLVEIEDPDSEKTQVTDATAILDFTDDRPDPRSGLRLVVGRNFPKPADSGQVEYYSLDTNLTAYIPLLTNSTWVFNYFQSDAHVTRQGERDRDQVAEDLGLLPCLATDNKCTEAREEMIDQSVAENKYGSAANLGGNSRLRSFISMRYRGAHTRFWGTEFRWNLTDESTLFNIWLMEDLRTSFQIAFFHEMATIADQTEDLYDETRSSTGIGVRAIMGSGLVYRLEYAVGEEGGQITLFFGYPWDFL
jgi:hypothetical protein